MNYRCVSNEETVLDLDFGPEYECNAQVVNIRAPITNKGRHGQWSMTSSRKSEIADRKLAALPGFRIELSARITDRRRTCSVFDYQSGENRVVIQAKQRCLWVNNKKEMELPLNWFDVELVFQRARAFIYVNGNKVCSIPYNPGNNIGIITTGETGSGTDYKIKAKEGALIEFIGASREL